MRFFTTVFLKEADEFLSTLDSKTVINVLYNDRRLFKKLHDEIWEFRTLFNGVQIRLMAFWDTRDKLETLVVATHGYVKKTSKVHKNEIDKAIALRKKYMSQK